MSGFDGTTAISGVGYTEFTRESGRTVLDLTAEACSRAIVDAGLDRDEIDGLICYHENDSGLARDVAAALGLPRVRWWSDVLAGGNYPAALVAQAAMAVATGMARHVVVWRVLNGRSGLRMGQFKLDEPGGVRQFMLPHGFGTPPQVFGMLCRRYMHESGVTRDHLAKVAITQRSNAVRKMAIPAWAVRLAAGSSTPRPRNASAIAEPREASLISSRSWSSALAAMTA